MSPASRRRMLRSVILAGTLAGLLAGTAQGQGLFGQPSGAGTPDLQHGALVFHGNYCGPGQRGRHRPPIDALDEACMHHDACSPPAESGRLASCACNARLKIEATRISDSPRVPDDLRALAGAVATGAALLPCQGRHPS